MQRTSGAPSSNMLIHKKIALRVLLPKGFPVRVYALVCNVFKPLSKQYSSCIKHRQEQKSCLFSALRSVLESNDSGRNISCTTPTGHWVVLNDTVIRLLTAVSYSQRTIDHKGSLDIFFNADEGKIFTSQFTYPISTSTFVYCGAISERRPATSFTWQ